MEIVVFCVYLLAVYECTSGQDSSGSDLTPHQALSELNSIHADFPNKMIKPILMELEKRPKLMNDIKNQYLELRAAHDTNSVIKLNPVNTSSDTGSMQISHAANSEFQIKPQRSDGVISFKRNAIEKVSTDLSKQKRIYVLNLPSRTFQKNDIEANNDHGIIFAFPNSLRKLQIISANAIDNLPQGTFTLTEQQTQLVSRPTSLNMIINPRRVVLLRRFLPRRIVLFPTNTLPVFNNRPLLSMVRRVGINPVPIPLTPFKVPGLRALIPIGMPAPMCFCSAQQPQCCPLKRLLIY